MTVTTYTVLREGQVIGKEVDEAHGVFNSTSIYAVVDLNKQAAIKVLSELYEDRDIERISRYLGGA